MSTENPDAAKGPVAGLMASARNALSSLLGIAQTRLEIISTELQEEVERAAGLLVWAFIALFATGLALLVGSLVLIFAFWETHRVLVSLLIVGFFLLLAITAMLVLHSRLKNRPRPFDATLAEFQRDRDHLEGKTQS